MNEGLLDIVVPLGIFWLIWSNFDLTKKVKNKRRLKHVLRALKHETRMNDDIYPEELNQQLRDMRKELEAEIKKPETQAEVWENKFKELEGKLPNRKYINWTARIESFVVAVALAFAFRAVVLQPFKIPTNSMRPTLHGVNIIPEETDKTQEFREKYLYPIYYGRAYYNSEFPQLSLGMHGSSRVDSLPDTRFVLSRILQTRIFYKTHNNQTDNFPGSEKHLLEGLIETRNKFGSLNPDAKITGYVETGDHLFVNRYAYNFREPRRGDIAVFETKQIKRWSGESLGGQFYIKRLAGLPGDTLKIDNNRDLYIRKKGDSDFVKIDQINPAFSKIMSKENGYNGYIRLTKFERYPEGLAMSGQKSEMGMNLFQYETQQGKFTYRLDGAQQILIKAEFENGYSMEFTDDADFFTLGKEQFFMLGDNSMNSLDSRMWGTVPRSHLMGVAHSVFWPFSKRWGWTDK